MEDEIYRGELSRLVALEPDKDAKHFAVWGIDSEYARLLDSDPVRLWSIRDSKEWFEKQQSKEEFRGVEFMIKTLDGDKTIGFVGLQDIAWQHRNGWLGIGIGDREYWNKGYGTDAMKIIARYTFEELGLHRINLNVFSYNTRAIHSYKKVGFQVEGYIPEAVYRDGQRWDMIYMGLLREDWKKSA
jgi:RimJ/RimL family protein N-acetyltransferase